MPNRERIAGALPTPMAAWLVENGIGNTWDQIGRDVAVSVCRELLAEEGEAGLGMFAYRQLEGQWTEAARTVARGLPIGRRWSANLLAAPVCRFFELFGAHEDVRRRLGKTWIETPQHPSTTPNAVTLAA